jgi:hypothetical protein
MIERFQPPLIEFERLDIFRNVNPILNRYQAVSRGFVKLHGSLDCRTHQAIARIPALGKRNGNGCHQFLELFIPSVEQPLSPIPGPSQEMTNDYT